MEQNSSSRDNEVIFAPIIWCVESNMERKTLTVLKKIAENY